MAEPVPEPSQEPVIFDNRKPVKETDFGIESFDFTPLPKSRFGLSGLNDKIFSLMRPKKPGASRAPPVTKADIERKKRLGQIETQYPHVPFVTPELIEGLENGLPIRKKNTFEIARDQIKNRFAFTASHKLINGLALVLVLIGAAAIYADIPTHPELLLGIVLVAVGSNVLIGSRD